MRPLALACLALSLATAPATGAGSDSDSTYLVAGLTHGGFEGVAPPGCTLDATSASATGASLAVGYRYAGPFAVEFGYLSLGALDLHGICGIAASPVTVSAPDSGVQLALLAGFGIAPRWELYGRAGLYSWSAAGRGGTEALLGVGAQRALGVRTALRLEHQRIGSDLDALNLTVHIEF